VFVDASAIVSILTEEDDAPDLAAALDLAVEPATSPIAIWEAAASISRKTGKRAEIELSDILEFLDLAGVGIEPVDMAVTTAAVAAFDRYGRRSGHPADLNMGDCFAYAFAQTRNIALLYKGKDFFLTDVQRYDESRDRPT
jgi:ribonuclease VapC